MSAPVEGFQWHIPERYQGNVEFQDVVSPVDLVEHFKRIPLTYTFREPLLPESALDRLFGHGDGSEHFQELVLWRSCLEIVQFLFAPELVTAMSLTDPGEWSDLQRRLQLAKLQIAHIHDTMARSFQGRGLSLPSTALSLAELQLHTDSGQEQLTQQLAELQLVMDVRTLAQHPTLRGNLGTAISFTNSRKTPIDSTAGVEIGFDLEGKSTFNVPQPEKPTQCPAPLWEKLVALHRQPASGIVLLRGQLKDKVTDHYEIVQSLSHRDSFSSEGPSVVSIAFELPVAVANRMLTLLEHNPNLIRSIMFSFLPYMMFQSEPGKADNTWPPSLLPQRFAMAVPQPTELWFVDQSFAAESLPAVAKKGQRLFQPRANGTTFGRRSDGTLSPFVPSLETAAPASVISQLNVGPIVVTGYNNAGYALSQNLGVHAQIEAYQAFRAQLQKNHQAQPTAGIWDLLPEYPPQLRALFGNQS